ncbi:hypothetical protein LCGC14_0303450 [marine sediment metagenome]|uniref:Uncharacterized protein n=1 Tax=marine sediment metagenome TaxID=412755 RepID=A0A0F9TUQ8_9ZZZZ
MAKKKPLKLDLEKGTLRTYVKRNYGEKGFTGKDTIKVSVLHDIKQGKKTPKGNKPNAKTKKRANFAINSRKWKK